MPLGILPSPPLQLEGYPAGLPESFATYSTVYGATARNISRHEQWFLTPYMDGRGNP